MRKRKQNSTTYHYSYYDAITGANVDVPIVAGKDGVTEEMIIFLNESQHEDELRERYAEENRDYGTENAKHRHDTECLIMVFHIPMRSNIVRI